MIFTSIVIKGVIAVLEFGLEKLTPVGDVKDIIAAIKLLKKARKMTDIKYLLGQLLISLAKVGLKTSGLGGVKIAIEAVEKALELL